MKSLCCIHKLISKHRKFTEHEYLKHRPREVLFSEHVYFVQICPVFAGPVTYNEVDHIKTCILACVDIHCESKIDRLSSYLVYRSIYYHAIYQYHSIYHAISTVPCALHLPSGFHLNVHTIAWFL